MTEPVPQKKTDLDNNLNVGLIAQSLEKADEFIDSPDIEMRKIGRGILEVAIRNLKHIQKKEETLGVLSDLGSVDISELSEEEQRHRKEDAWALEMFDKLKDAAYDGMFVADSNGGMLMVNKAIEEITGYSSDELIGMSFSKLIHQDDIDGVIERVRASAEASDDHDPQEFRVVARDGSIRYVRVSTFALSSASEREASEVGGMMTDITETKKLQEKLERLSLHDSLTGLPNRHYWEIELERLKISRRYPISIISIDVDNLKKINDTGGHEQGDGALIIVAGLLSVNLRGGDFVARIGGDEFVIPLPDTNEQAANEMIERIGDTFDFYNTEVNRDTPLYLSAGAATANNPAEFELALQKADLAMYEEKRKKKEIEARSSLKAQLNESDY